MAMPSHFLSNFVMIGLVVCAGDNVALTRSGFGICPKLAGIMHNAMEQIDSWNYYAWTFYTFHRISNVLIFSLLFAGTGVVILLIFCFLMVRESRKFPGKRHGLLKGLAAWQPANCYHSTKHFVHVSQLWVYQCHLDFWEYWNVTHLVPDLIKTSYLCLMCIFFFRRETNVILFSLYVFIHL